jgi:hypothetical protein
LLQTERRFFEEFLALKEKRQLRPRHEIPFVQLDGFFESLLCLLELIKRSQEGTFRRPIPSLFWLLSQPSPWNDLPDRKHPTQAVDVAVRVFLCRTWEDAPILRLGLPSSSRPVFYQGKTLLSW